MNCVSEDFSFGLIASLFPLDSVSLLPQEKGYPLAHSEEHVG